MSRSALLRPTLALVVLLAGPWLSLSQDQLGEPIFTAADPGPWAGKEAAHLPAISVTKTDAGWRVAVAVKHVMVAEPLHFIQWIRLKDGDGSLLGQKEFTPSDAKPEAVFELKTLPARLAAFEHCNIHGLWRSDYPPAAK